MTRWNIVQIAFYGVNRNRRTIDLRPDEVAILTGRSGTGKSAIVAAIDYCLGSGSCELPDYVRRRCIGVATHWRNGETDLIVGRVVPDSGIGTDRMFVQSGRSLVLPDLFDNFEGPAGRATARKIIERAFGISDVEDADAEDKSTVGKASIRHITPYLFLTADVIISNKVLLHDLNDPDKARDIRATIPYFLQAIDQKTVLAQRKLRRLEAYQSKLDRQAKAQQKSRSLLADRAMALISQSAELGMSHVPDPSISEQEMLHTLADVASFDIKRTDKESGDQLGVLEEARREAVRIAASVRENRNSLRQLVKDSSGFETTASAQFQKLNLAKHLKLDTDICPVCQQASSVCRDVNAELQKSLFLIEREVAQIQQVAPELLQQLEKAEEECRAANEHIRQIETQIRGVIQQNEALRRSDDLAQARAITLGRVAQFLETTADDFLEPKEDLEALLAEIEQLRDQVDPQALRDRISYVESMVSNYATEMLTHLPTTAPLTDARLQFFADGRLRVVEAERQRHLSMVEVGSDQNYLAIHLALLFALHKHIERAGAPVPGLLVIDQISRPYYPKDVKAEDERSLEEIASDDDRRSMSEIVNFIFSETAKASGLQVLLIEHAYIESDLRYTDATIERWTRENGKKLIPEDWSERD